MLTVDQADQVSAEKWAATVPKVLLACQVLQVNQVWTVKLADEVFKATPVKMVQLVNQDRATFLRVMRLAKDTDILYTQYFRSPTSLTKGLLAAWAANMAAS